ADLLERLPEFLAELDRERARGRTTYAEVEESEADLHRFQSWLAKIAARDYFDAPGAAEAQTAVERCAAELAAFEEAALAAEAPEPTPTPVPGQRHLHIADADDLDAEHPPSSFGPSQTAQGHQHAQPPAKLLRPPQADSAAAGARAVARRQRSSNGTPARPWLDRASMRTSTVPSSPVGMAISLPTP